MGWHMTRQARVSERSPWPKRTHLSHNSFLLYCFLCLHVHLVYSIRQATAMRRKSFLHVDCTASTHRALLPMVHTIQGTTAQAYTYTSMYRYVIYTVRSCRPPAT